MWCTTECWDCEDKTCEHYRSKLDLYFENKRLTNNWNELEEWLKDLFEKGYDIKLVLDKMKEIKGRKDVSNNN